MKLIDVKKLSFEYFRRDEEGNVAEMIPALNNVSLDIAQGEFVAILGQNGSGKSTLAKHLNALLLPEEGQVIVDGMDTLDEEVRFHIRQTAGMVFQNPDNQIVANLVEEDVAFGPENLGVPTADIWNRVDNALEATDMNSFRHKSPNQLSGGQKQRVAIAGVLAMEPKCIIFDEATAMLDPAGRKQIIKIAHFLQKEKGITIILITHHMDEVLLADRVFVMQKGNIMATGTPSEIFEKKQLLENCGLCLPPLYEYMQFLVGQEILTPQETTGISNVETMVECLTNRFKGQHGKNAVNIDIREKDVEDENQKRKNGEGLIVHHVSYIYNKGYANETIALKDVDFSVGKGEFVAIIGHTGSGKSTFMQLLNGLYLPTEGTVYFNGQDIGDKDFPMKELRQKVGLVFQYPEYQLFAETVEKDVCFGPENMDISKVEAQKRAYEAIAAVGLPDTIYDYSPLQLSGGQKRRVAIAGVLAMKPDYLVLDEPTAGLDPKSAKELLTMLKSLQTEQGITIVLVSHDMEQVAEYSDRIVVMSQGEKKMDGEPSEIFTREAELQDMGLEIPFGVKLLYGLKKVIPGIDIRACRKMDICGELLKLKEIS